MAQSQTPRNRCVRFVAGVAVGSRNTHYRAARYGLTQTGLSPVGMHQLWLALSEIEASPRTIEVHRARVFEKLQARSLPDLVRLLLAAQPKDTTQRGGS